MVWPEALTFYSAYRIHKRAREHDSSFETLGLPRCVDQKLEPGAESATELAPEPGAASAVKKRPAAAAQLALKKRPVAGGAAEPAGSEEEAVPDPVANVTRLRLNQPTAWACLPTGWD